MPAALLARYGALRLPRYTSYPTAAEFTDAVGPAQHARWLGRLDPAESVSLYVHVPYCRALCHYCGCHAKLAIRDEVVANYRRHLEAEIALVGRHLPRRLRAARLHWGGGTPSILEAQGLAGMIEALGALFDFEPGFEHAIELDPRSVTPDLARALARLGITRASLGVQDLEPRVQAAIGRIQPLAVVEGAVEALRAAGIAAINVDLIYGLPHQTAESVAETAFAVASLAPSRVAAYGYAHLPERRRNQRLIDAAALPGPAERYAQSQALAHAFAASGYVGLGIDHFARAGDPLAAAAAEGRLHRNFQGYTDDDRATLIGFGASAISHLAEGYVQIIAETGAYARAVAAGRLPSVRGYALTDDDRRRATIIEALMCNFGVDLPGREALSDFADELALLRPLEADGLLTVRDSRVTLSTRGRPFVRVAASIFDRFRYTTAEAFSAAV